MKISVSSPGFLPSPLATPIIARPPSPRFDKRSLGTGDLPLATVDQDQIRNHPFAAGQTFITPADDLTHGGEIVSGLDVADVEAPVIRLFHAVSLIDHAGCNCRLALRMADVETLNTVNGFGQRQCLLQCLQALFLLRRSLISGDDGQPAVLQCHVGPRTMQNGARFNDGNCPACQFGKQLSDVATLLCFWLRQRDNPGWCGVGCVMLPNERCDGLAQRTISGIYRKLRTIAEMSPAPDHGQIDAKLPAFAQGDDDVDVLPLAAGNILLFLYLAQRLDLVAIDRRLLECKAPGCYFHRRGQAPRDFLLAPEQEHRGQLDIGRVVLRADQRDTGSQCSA